MRPPVSAEPRPDHSSRILILKHLRSGVIAACRAGRPAKDGAGGGMTCERRLS